MARERPNGHSRSLPGSTPVMGKTVLTGSPDDLGSAWARPQILLARIDAADAGAAPPIRIRRRRSESPRTAWLRPTSPASAPCAWRRHGRRSCLANVGCVDTALPPTSRMTSPVFTVFGGPSVRIDRGDHAFAAGARNLPAGVSIRPRRGPSLPSSLGVGARLALLRHFASVSDSVLVSPLRSTASLTSRPAPWRRSSWRDHGILTSRR